MTTYETVLVLASERNAAAHVCARAVRSEHWDRARWWARAFEVLDELAIKASFEYINAGRPGGEHLSR